MALQVATWLLSALGVYLAIGVLFALPFLRFGVQRIDPTAEHGTLGFRLLILPGTVALWPLLALRLRSGKQPEERGAHRDRARKADGRGEA